MTKINDLDLKNWKVYLIGPIHPDFQIKIDTFYQQYPDKKNQVIFTGAIYNKKELWSYYNKAKVFVLTSRWESYALVLNEAKIAYVELGTLEPTSFKLEKISLEYTLNLIRVDENGATLTVTPNVEEE